MNLGYSLYLLFILVAGVLGEKHDFEWYNKSIPFHACAYEIKNAENFKFCPTMDGICICSNENALATLAGCLAYKDANTTYLTHYGISYCHVRFKINLESDWFDTAFKRFTNKAVNQSEIESMYKLVQTPVIFSSKDMDFYDESAAVFFGNYNTSTFFGLSVFGFWLVFLLINTISYWTKVLFPQATRRSVGLLATFYRKHISMPALYGKRRTQEVSCFKVFDSLVPSRFEMMVISLFYIFILITHAVRVHGLKDDPIFGSKYMAELRYVGDRTGIVATFMMPLLFLFAGRNNFLQWVTGINYSSFLCYHRHIARVMFILVVVHSVNYTILLVRTDQFIVTLKKQCLRWGITATIVGGTLIIQSILYLRRNWYELFLLIHIVMAMFYVVGTWVHLNEFGYEIYLYSTIGVWGLDRIVRLFRLLSFGFPKVNVMLVGNDVIKLEIPKPKSWKPIPGGHAFVHFLKPTYFWQSHPFTFTNSTKDNEDRITMYLRVKGGVTHSLYQLLNTTPGKMVKMRVSIEGPYGESTPAKYADKAVFFAGGNGIPGIYSEVSDIALRSSPQRKSILKLFWIIRDYDSILWFFDELLKLKDMNIETTIYVTRPNIKSFRVGLFNQSQSSQGSSIKPGYEETKSNTCDIELAIAELKLKLLHIKFEEGRPNVEQLIGNEIKQSPGSTAFVACGHPIMVDEVRYYSCKNIDNTYNKRVDYYDQLQIWA